MADVLPVQGLDILSAEALSDEQGMAASRFHVREAPNVGWCGVVSDVRAASCGKLDVGARL